MAASPLSKKSNAATFKEADLKKIISYTIISKYVFKYSETCLYRLLYVRTFAMYQHDCSVLSKSLYILVDTSKYTTI